MTAGMAGSRKYLVITRAGANSLHRAWLEPQGARNFDLFLTTYAPGVPPTRSEGVIEAFIPGTKVAGWRRIVEDYRELLLRYEFVAFIDDDIITDAIAISRMFEIGEEAGLHIWQPSLSPNSYFTYAGTLRNPIFRYRSVNFIEMMCPFFSIDALNAVSGMFRLGLESGIDLVWCSLVPERMRQFAIIDEVSVHHSRPVSGQKEENGFGSAGYEEHIYACLNQFEMKWPSLIASGGVLRNGRKVGRIQATALTALCMAGYMMKSWRSGPRPFLEHIRHQFSRKVEYTDSAGIRLNWLLDKEFVFNARLAEPSSQKS